MHNIFWPFRGWAVWVNPLKKGVTKIYANVKADAEIKDLRLIYILIFHPT